MPSSASVEHPLHLPTLPFLHMQKDGSVRVDIHVMPNAARTQIQGLHDGALKVRLHAPPVDGKANEALLVWMAEVLGIPRAAVVLLRGAGARQKRLGITASAALRADWQALVTKQA